MVNPLDEDGEIRREDDDVALIAAQARRDDAARERLRRAAVEQRSAEATSIVTALVAAIDSNATIHAKGWSDPLTGTVVAVGSDVVEVLVGTTTWFVAIDSIGAVATSGRARSGGAADRSSAYLAEVLVDLVVDDSAIALVLGSGHRIGGHPVAVGESLVVSGSDGSTAVVDIAAISAFGVQRR